MYSRDQSFGGIVQRGMVVLLTVRGMVVSWARVRVRLTIKVGQDWR